VNAASPPGPDLRAARRQLLLDTAGIVASIVAFGFVFGLAAKEAGFSPLEASAMSLLCFAGAAQFAAVGYVAAGLPWLPIVVLTAALNARHLLYSASLAPGLRRVASRPHRALMAHFLTDEAFALTAAHFHRLGAPDAVGYWIAAVVGVYIPWNLATLAGVLLGGAIVEPTSLGLDIVFPAAMAGLAVGLVTGRRELVAAGTGAVLGVVASLALGPGVGIVAGGLLGPLAGMAVPEGRVHLAPESEVSGQPVDIDLAVAEAGTLDDAAIARSDDGPQAGTEPPERVP
jgi:4-azaleucine resistance transporter AzlC